MKINFIKEFNKDLGIVISNKIQNKDFTSKKGFYWGGFLLSYILLKPWYIYYKGKLERKVRLKKLKDEGKYILN